MQRRVSDPNNSRQIADVVNEIVSQFDGTTGSFSLATTGTTTTVQNAKITSQSAVFLQAKSANSAVSNAWISAVTNGGFTVNHVANSSARPFDYWVSNV